MLSIRERLPKIDSKLSIRGNDCSIVGLKPSQALQALESAPKSSLTGLTIAQAHKGAYQSVLGFNRLVVAASEWLARLKSLYDWETYMVSGSDVSLRCQQKCFSYFNDIDVIATMEKYYHKHNATPTEWEGLYKMSAQEQRAVFFGCSPFGRNDLIYQDSGIRVVGRFDHFYDWQAIAYLVNHDLKVSVVMPSHIKTLLEVFNSQ